MLVLDIETIKDDKMSEPFMQWMSQKKLDKRLKDPVKVAENINDVLNSFGLDPLTGSILLVGIATDNTLLKDFLKVTPEDFVDESVAVKQLVVNELYTEESMLIDLWHILNLSVQISEKIITYNGKSFDIPYIIKRSLINLKLGFRHTVGPTFAGINLLTNKYNNTRHIDLFVELGERGTQNEWCYRLGISESLQNDGSRIQEWYNEGKIDFIMAKNRQDLYQLSTLYRMVEGIFV